ncbi:hypothetical protein ACFZCY_42570 [Streptomyces sp. NPDC007983]|uniref:hypothetical protein n=1 Tax=Streptomyces sp. NPDC007983 TaxID=3364800 RepID=UPI0036E6D57E
MLTLSLWTDLLTEHGLVADRVDVLTDPEGDTPLSCTLVQARRPLPPPPERRS